MNRSTQKKRLMKLFSFRRQIPDPVSAFETLPLISIDLPPFFPSRKAYRGDCPSGKEQENIKFYSLKYCRFKNKSYLCIAIEKNNCQEQRFLG